MKTPILTLLMIAALGTLAHAESAPVELSLPSETVNSVASAALSDTLFVVAYTDAKSNIGHVVAVERSGDDLKEIGRAEIQSVDGIAPGFLLSVARVSEKRFIVLFRGQPSPTGSAVVGEVEGNTIRWLGDPSQFSRGKASHFTALGVGDGRVLLAYNDESMKTGLILLATANESGYQELAEARLAPHRVPLENAYNTLIPLTADQLVLAYTDNTTGGKAMLRQINLLGDQILLQEPFELKNGNNPFMTGQPLGKGRFLLAHRGGNTSAASTEVALVRTKGTGFEVLAQQSLPHQSMLNTLSSLGDNRAILSFRDDGAGRETGLYSIRIEGDAPAAEPLPSIPGPSNLQHTVTLGDRAALIEIAAGHRILARLVP